MPPLLLRWSWAPCSGLVLVVREPRPMAWLGFEADWFCSSMSRRLVVVFVGESWVEVLSMGWVLFGCFLCLGSVGRRDRLLLSWRPLGWMVVRWQSAAGPQTRCSVAPLDRTPGSLPPPRWVSSGGWRRGPGPWCRVAQW